MNITRLRQCFSALADGRRIYLDNAATSLTPDLVISEVARYFREYNVNAGRGAYLLAARLSREIEDARDAVALFIKASTEEIVFTFNTTDSINKLASSFPFLLGDRVVVSQLEHHSNLLPWRQAAQRYGLEIEVIPQTSMGVIDLDKAHAIISRGCRLLAITAASNVLGTTQPVTELVAQAGEVGAKVFVDAAQWVAHLPLDVKEWGCDYLAFSAHKMSGPQGVGVLYVKKGREAELKPAFLGGGSVRDVTDSDFNLKDFPYSFEAGTMNLSGIMGFKSALSFMRELGFQEIGTQVSNLHELLGEGLREKKGVEIYTPDHTRNVGITAFNLKDVSPHHAATQYDCSAGIMLRSGFHCAIPLVKTLGRGQGCLRASVAFYNTEDEIKRFLEVTDEVLAGV